MMNNILFKYKKTIIFVLSIFLTLNFSLTWIFLFSLKQSSASYRNQPLVSQILESRLLEKQNTKRNIEDVLITLRVNQSEVLKKLNKEEIEIIQIKIDPDSMNKLNEDLPLSGKFYQDVKVKFDDRDWTDSKMKYRGDNNYHWGFEKKSINLKIDDNNKINLVNPKSPNFISDFIALELATNNFHLISPQSHWSAVFLNNDFLGIYQNVEDLNDDFAIKNSFKSIVEGENIAFGYTSGLPLFVDYSKWKQVAGFSDQTKLQNLISICRQNKISEIVNFFSLDYLLNFYSYVAFISNSHYDEWHNWFLGLKNDSLFYPIIWDPVAWMDLRKKGNSVEEMVSPISTNLRKNIYFNQLFAENTWEIINNLDLKDLEDQIEDEKLYLSKLLSFDLYKGGSLGNEKGNRGRQSSNDIFKEIEDLKTLIKQRTIFLKKELASAKAELYVGEEWIYITYKGLAGGFLDGLNFQNEIYVFNNGTYVLAPQFNNGPTFLWSGRKKENVRMQPYATTCATTYRIPLTFSVNNLKLHHSLTGKEIDFVQTNQLKPEDCSMNFSHLEGGSAIEEYSHDNKNIFEIDFSKQRVGDYFSFYKKVQDDLTIKINGTKHLAKVKKDKHSNILKIRFKDIYNNSNKFYLVPQSYFHTDGLIPEDIAQNYNHLSNFESFLVYANDFKIGTYFLIEDLDKPLLEKNGLTWDTDIFTKKCFDTSKITSFDKVSSDVASNIDDFSPLEEFIVLINKQDSKLINYLDLNNFISNFNLMYRTGNDNLDYAFYYDKTSGKFKIISFLSSFYRNDSWQIKDPLLKKIFSYLRQENFIILDSETDQFLPNYSQVSNQVCKTNLQEVNKLIIRDKLVFENNNTYFIDDDLIISEGCLVEINPGVKIKIAPLKSIISYAQIMAIGNESNPIEIESQDLDRPFGSFGLIGSGANESFIEYLHISNGSETANNEIYFSGMFSAYHTDDVVVKNSVFKNAQADDALNFKYSNSSVYDCLFENNSADAIDFDYMSGEISGSTFINNGNDSIDTSGSTTLVKNNYIKDSGDKCISVGENSYLTITNNILDGCNIGIEAKDESEPIITHTLFKDNKVALNAYQKKDFFGSAYPKIYNSVFINNDKNLTLENTFEGEKLDSDNSEIYVINSLFDNISEKQLTENNLENKDLLNLGKESNYSLINEFFPRVEQDRPQNLVDNIVGLVYPNQIPSL